MTSPLSLPRLFLFNWTKHGRFYSKMTKGNFIRRFRYFEISLSAGKGTRLVTHKLVDQKIKNERQKNVIFEPIGQNMLGLIIPGFRPR